MSYGGLHNIQFRDEIYANGTNDRISSGNAAKTAVTTWGALSWKEEIGWEDLLVVWMRQLKGRLEDVAEGVQRKREA